MPKIGILALQGDFEAHAAVFRRLGASVRLVRLPQDLEGLDGLVLPGGESTTIGRLMVRVGLDAAIRERAARGMAVWGTCAGMILLAQRIVSSDQPRLGLLDMEVARNAFGRQIESFEAPLEVSFDGEKATVLGVFIRAPWVSGTGPGVEVLCTFRGKVVAVRCGRILATAFHPELTGDDTLQRQFLRMAGEG
jgi:5'-phosphate synthase pdxT subunit